MLHHVQLILVVGIQISGLKAPKAVEVLRLVAPLVNIRVPEYDILHQVCAHVLVLAHRPLDVVVALLEAPVADLLVGFLVLLLSLMGLIIRIKLEVRVV